MSRLARIVAIAAASPVPLLIVSVCLNVVLANGLSRSRAATQALRDEGRLKVGTIVGDLRAATPSGDPVTIRYSDVSVPTVLYVMKPTCGWCKRNNANLQALDRRGVGAYRLIVVSLAEEGAAAYLSAIDVRAQLLVNVTSATEEEYKMGGTPPTIVVSPSGVVLDSWLGAYTGAVAPQVEAALGVRLPGLLPAAAAPKAIESQ